MNGVTPTDISVITPGVIQCSIHASSAASLHSAAILIAGILAASASPASSACAGNSTDQAQVAKAVRTMYSGATTDDLGKFHTVAAPDFYALDGGERHDGDALMKMVKRNG
jgi:hypothetical protein